MRVAFKEIKNYEKYGESFHYHVIDLDSKVQRYQLHQLIDEQAYMIGREEENKFGSESYDEVMEEAEAIHKAISNQDSSLPSQPFEHFSFLVEPKVLKEELEKHGYNVESSMASNSLYIHLTEGTIRIADHTRPPVINEIGDAEHHEYLHEFICCENIFPRELFEKADIHLPPGEYHLY